MDTHARQQAEAAVQAFDAALEEGSQLSHERIADAVRLLIGLRNQLLKTAADGETERSTLDRVNALVSLAHGAEQPLAGMHLHRIQQTRAGLCELLGQR